MSKEATMNPTKVPFIVSDQKLCRARQNTPRIVKIKICATTSQVSTALDTINPTPLKFANNLKSSSFRENRNYDFLNSHYAQAFAFSLFRVEWASG
jgi:hypothetical protein